MEAEDGHQLVHSPGNFESVLDSKYVNIRGSDKQGKRLLEPVSSSDLELLCYTRVLGVSLSEVCSGASP